MVPRLLGHKVHPISDNLTYKYYLACSMPVYLSSCWQGGERERKPPTSLTGGLMCWCRSFLAGVAGGAAGGPRWCKKQDDPALPRTTVPVHCHAGPTACISSAWSGYMAKSGSVYVWKPNAAQRSVCMATSIHANGSYGYHRLIYIENVLRCPRSDNQRSCW